MENPTTNDPNNHNQQEISNTTGIVTLGNLNSVANWVSASVSSAFFSSLDRFSCVNVSTTDPDDDDDDYPDEAKDRPLNVSSNPPSDLPV